MNAETTALIAAYTAGVLAARRAYRIDRAVEQGYCAACGRRKTASDKHRTCQICRMYGRREYYVIREAL